MVATPSITHVCAHTTGCTRRRQADISGVTGQTTTTVIVTSTCGKALAVHLDLGVATPNWRRPTSGDGLCALSPINTSICKAALDHLRHRATLTGWVCASTLQGSAIYIAVGVVDIALTVIVGIETGNSPSTLSIISTNTID